MKKVITLILALSGKFEDDYYDDIDGMAGELLSKGKVLARLYRWW